LAVGIDLAIQIGVTVAIGVLLLVTTRVTAGVPVGLTKTSQAVVAGIGVVAVFLVYFGYFIVFELWWSGRTPGKRALGIRVVRDAGFPIDIGAATIRNLVRVIEFGLGFYAVAALSALLSAQNKRLGDFAAGTIVVRDRRDDQTDIDAYLRRDNERDDGLTPEDRTLVERYLLRRAQLEPGARTTLAAQIADRVRPRLRASFAHLDDDALLEHLGRPT
jgi:uncharacterized RDD family membrane protein YckC